MKLASAEGRWLIAATVGASGMAFLDGSIVSLALPDVDRDLDAGLSGLQWTVNAYMLTLSSFVLVAGSLGDRLGRRRIFNVGVAWFGVASILCAVAPSIEMLVAARALQGIGAALLTPGSLAIISTSIDKADRGRAIGLWAGLSGVAGAAGPLMGGWLVDQISWRAIFWINVPLVVATIAISLRYVPETKGAQGRIDFGGAGLTVVSLAFLTYGLAVEEWMPTVAGLLLLIAFVLHQWRTPHALVPISLFADRVFTALNICTFAIYGALSGGLFLLVLQLQYVTGYSPLEAGLATLPPTILLLLFSGRAGALGERLGPRLPMTVGPLIASASMLLYLRVDADASIVDVIVPGIVFGIGLTILVAPLTTSVLASAPADQTGIASGINNAVARTAALLAVAAIPPLAGIAGADFASPEVFSPGYRTGMMICAGMLAAAGVFAALMIQKPKRFEEVLHAPEQDVV
ncbi:MFS transporter [Aeromicrobium sp.]|uniref:MFS transporter n=1 Tax=Aeromicrobium sp. TaxID=1871063 RepID=UPI003D6B0614